MFDIKHSIMPTKSFFVAVSGGVDSIVACHLLWKLSRGKSNFTVCHFNHNLRPQNDLMEESVRQFCEDHALKFVTKKLQREFEWGTISGSSEDFLRQHRLDFFKELLGDVVLGHHLDDCVESYMMNCLTGVPEYTPIPEKTTLVCKDMRLIMWDENAPHSLIRPFLRTPKKTFTKYATKNRLWKYVVEDETNKDTKYRRNWVRNDILPQFENLGLRKIVLKKFYT